MDKHTSSKTTDTVDNFIKRAFAFVKSQNLEAAEQIFVQIVHQQPDQWNALYGLGMIYFNRDQRQQATEYFKSVLRLIPQHVPSLEYLALMTFEAEDWGEAQRYIEQLINLDPHNRQHQKNLANLYKNLGQPQTLTEKYQSSLVLKPDYVELLEIIGDFHFKKNEYFQAEQAYKKALAIQPNLVNCLVGLGAVKHRRGDDQNAIRYSKMVLDLEPRNSAARRNLTEIFADKQRVTEAEQYYLRSFSLNPKQTASLNNLGMLYEAQHEYDKAKEYYKRALSINPNVVNTLTHLAHVYDLEGAVDKAIKYYEQVLTLEPDNIGVLNQLGAIRVDAQDYEHAESYFLRALAADDSNTDTYLHLANLYFHKHNFLEAEEWISRTLHKKPDSHQAYGILGNIYAASIRYAESAHAYQRALALKPSDTMSLLNLANLYVKQGHYSEAVKAYQHTLHVYAELDQQQYNPIKLNQDAELCRFNLSIVQLLLGQFAQGWENYHSRKSVMRSSVKLSHLIPYWNGRDSLAGKTVYLFEEQGFGDYIQWVRFSEHLKAQEARVVAMCPPPLTTLFQTCPWVDTAQDDHQVLNPVNSVQVLASDLPRYFNVDLATIPATTPYLFADRYKTETLKKTLGHSNRLKIGICWHGNEPSTTDQTPKLRLENFAPLFRDKHFQVFGLVVDDAQNELRRFRNYVMDTRPLIKDFSDTAAIIEALDLVITADTAVAHLAGAMNKPCWVLLPTVPDWRWLLERNDSPWYPSLRLYRLPLAHPWEDVIKNVRKNALKLPKSHR